MHYFVFPFFFFRYCPNLAFVCCIPSCFASLFSFCWLNLCCCLNYWVHIWLSTFVALNNIYKQVFFIICVKVLCNINYFCFICHFDLYQSSPIIIIIIIIIIIVGLVADSVYLTEIASFACDFLVLLRLYLYNLFFYGNELKAWNCFHVRFNLSRLPTSGEVHKNMHCDSSTKTSWVFALFSSSYTVAISLCEIIVPSDTAENIIT